MLSQNLNLSQKNAVNHDSGPLLVLSGAGMGKTKVLTSRFVYLVQKLGVPFNQILAVTFTNKAANEIKQRVQRSIGYSIDSPWIGTFHSVFAKFLRKYANLVGLKNNFSILPNSINDRSYAGLLIIKTISSKTLFLTPKF